VRLCSVVLALALVSPLTAARGQSLACDSLPSSTVELVPPGASWVTLQRVVHQHPCDDGMIAESFSDYVVHRLATHWGTVPQLTRLVNADSVLRAFVIQHIDATTDMGELRRLVRLSKTRCPPSSRNFCAAIRVAAEAAVASAT
jgi:hypothetical protein